MRLNALCSSTAAHDLDATLNLIADDAIYLFSNRTSHIGKAAIREVLIANFESIRSEAYKIRNLQWLVISKEVAACVYEFAWSGEIDDKPASGGGRGTSILRCIDGDWLVVHEHLSPGPLKG